MHYSKTTGKPEKDRSSVALVFARKPVEKMVISLDIMNFHFRIPAGADNHQVTACSTFKKDVEVVSFMPHMHLRGKDFEYKLVYPDGTSKVLLSVPRYDFNWQLLYQFKDPLFLPKGTRLDCVAHFDNSAKNKYNPDPTKEVRWGDQTWEEMMIGWFDYILDKENLAERASTK